MDQDAEEPAQKPASTTSFSAAPESVLPLRDDQVAQAVSFLTHPKVIGSSPAQKRSFLEGKGLTAAEIQEAFNRAPQGVYVC